MKVAAALIATLLCAGCEQRPKSVQQCESLLLTKLKAPSTYKAFDTVVGGPDRGKQQVAITYDAVNSYNAPIRGTFFCSFDISSGLADEDKSAGAALGETPVEQLDLPAAPTPSRAEATNAMEKQGELPDEVPVCDQPDSPAKFALMNEIGTDCIGE